MITINLSQNQMPQIIMDEEGVKRSIFTTYDSLLEFLVNAQHELDDDDREELEQMRNQEVENAPGKIVMSSPALPPNTVRYGVADNGVHYLQVTTDESVHDAVYHNAKFENIAYPKMVFTFKIAENRLSGVSVACYKDRVLRDTTQLYRYPFSNVYTNGTLCYWNREEIKDLVQLQTFAYRWKEVEHNDHLYDQSTCNTLNLPLRQVFETLQNQPCNYDMLVPMDITFKNWSSTILGWNEYGVEGAAEETEVGTEATQEVFTDQDTIVDEEAQVTLTVREQTIEIGLA